MDAVYRAFAPDKVRLGPGLFQDRFNVNRDYLLSLRQDNLLQNHYLEAALGQYGQLRNTLHGDPGAGDDRHWGWESPTCEVRGQFLGHWLSAAARAFAGSGDMELKLKVDRVVAELGRCQEKNGGEWVFSIPEKYLHWTAEGRPTWAPHYVIHKTLMGLFDAYRYVSSDEALTILNNAARWFHKWSGRFSREHMDDILDTETGAMLEVWADLYGATGSESYKELMERYTRSRLFKPLMEGRDVLTNMHANTTIPEIHGAARAYEVTGDPRWREIVERYWECAVTERGTFCTGGQTSGEIWTPPFEFSARLGDKNQEHCTVYNMIRLADFLFRWSGDAGYCDYIEKNIYNGILAQQNPLTGMISYFLPLQAGARKLWGTATCDFWCCHGTLVQAHTAHNAYVFYGQGEEIVISQFIPSRLTTVIDGNKVVLDMMFDHQSSGSADDNSSAAGLRHRPGGWAVEIRVSCEAPTDMVLKLRIPGWIQGRPSLRLNGEDRTIDEKEGPFFHAISRIWNEDTVRLELPKGITTSALPDETGMRAFMDGPITLAGLCDREQALIAGQKDPGSLLVPDNEREWGRWMGGYRTKAQPTGLRFKPLHEIVDEPYTVYFPVTERGR